ncbi:hypothetical protein GZ989_011425 (plasmid) [Campylobacter fetus]|uniref:Uncharacterized protein n=1 Tax=Campylobacter fetus TaxID=196 RepID=A0A974MRJ2_CAMFE|nr:hypothetical protein [Campylobacter fetus]OCS32881.1 hypothetical protein AWR31_08040 [Campylobacter fetus subsp. venerealis]QMS59883.1 hypothetical protein GZ989_011425 [Campylobacter fetus]
MSEVMALEEKIKKIKTQLLTLENRKKDMIAKEQIKLSLPLMELIKTNQDFLKELIDLLDKHKAKDIIESLKKYQAVDVER